MKFFLIFILAVLSYGRAASTNYYLSGKGNDEATGTSSATPWRTLKKLCDSRDLIQPGDSILFERGSVFQGTLSILRSGLPGSEIYIGAYGRGEKPVISGSIEIKNWKPFRENLWVAECPDCNSAPANFFIDGKFQPLGRFPNAGYNTIACPSPCQTSITDQSLSFADGYWDGAEVVVKSSRWTLDNITVQSYSNKTFSFTNIPSYGLQNGFGYFIQKHVSTLDKHGEWFFDSLTKKLFVYLNPKLKPGDHVIEVSVKDLGLKMVNVHDIIIENLAFKYQSATGVFISSSDNISLQLCDVAFAGKNALEVTSCQNPKVEKNRITDANNNGVEWKNNVNGVFARNAILRTGLHAGRGSSGNGTYNALSISSELPLAGRNTFEYNTIDSTGYLGIDFRTGHTYIINNLISNFCMTKDDGAGIYTWRNAYGDNLIEGNIIVNGSGSLTGRGNLTQQYVSGIYMDDFT